jgi:hypothetical protein
MSSTEEFHDWNLAQGEHAPAAAPHRVNLIALLGVIAAIAGILALYALAGQLVLAIWAALALVGWMFIAGAARVSSD